MIDTIISLIGGIKGLIIGGLGLLGSLWMLWVKRQNANLKTENQQQAQAIKGHEAKEKVHVKDQEIETNADNKVDNLREQVEHATSQEQAAEQIGFAIDEYFNGKKQ